jgi:opacity protein-like surface antigen/outer membrane protease
MLRTALAVTSVSALVMVSSAAWADGYEPKSVAPAPFSWSGMYVGYHVGGAWGEAHISDPFGPSVFGDNVRTPGPLMGLQAGANMQFGSLVLGLEGDFSWADLDGTNTCFAFSGFFVSSNCQVHVSSLGTLTGRLGFAVGPQGRTLLYAKGGAAYEHVSAHATANGALGAIIFGANGTQNTDGPKTGWTVGGGVERAIGGNWSVKAEYDFLSFGDARLTTPTSAVVFPNGSVFLAPGVVTSTTQDIHEFKVGLNYKLGGDTRSLDPDWGRGSLKDGPVNGPRTEIEVGGRYVHGWGRFQKDLGIQGLGSDSLASRLTYDGMHTDGGEVFARVDTHNNFMVKGLLGAGSGSSGSMNDEDWLLPFGPNLVAYSNTVSNVDNRIRYGTIDAGYDWMRGPGYKVASYVGFNYLSQNMKALGCTQIANAFSDCVPPIPTSVLGITEDDTWKSLRLGMAADFKVLPGVRVSADAAYLPYVWFDGTDNHVLRALVSPEDGHGQGVQLDLTLSFALTDQFSVGVGGRYWAMWTTSGDTNFGGTGIIIPQRFAAEQAAVTVQASYKFGVDNCCVPLK